MKKFLLLIWMICFVINSSAQITITQIKAEDTPKKESIEYDSTKNWLGDKNIKSYIGQTLYVNGKKDIFEKREWGYADFYAEREPVLHKPYGNISVNSEYHTKYEDLVGRYFVVDEIHQGKFKSFGHWWFLMHEKNNPEEKVWFKYSEEFEHTWPFIVVSYFEYLKKKCIGEKYFSSETNKEDIKTGKPIVLSLNEFWECVDVTIEDKSYDLALVVKNQKGETSFIEVHSLGKQENGTYIVYEKLVYDDYVKKFGITNMNKIMQRKVSIGMTKEMCRASWGEPNDINKTTGNFGVHEQWVYKNGYLYFENGKLTNIQN